MSSRYLLLQHTTSACVRSPNITDSILQSLRLVCVVQPKLVTLHLWCFMVLIQAAYYYYYEKQKPHERREFHSVVSSSTRGKFPIASTSRQVVIHLKFNLLDDMPLSFQNYTTLRITDVIETNVKPLSAHKSL